MNPILREKYTPERCDNPRCGQTITYLLALDRGTADIMKAFSIAVWKKGANVIHPRKEMEIAGRGVTYEEAVREGHLTSNQVGNLSRAHRHGLIAKVKGLPGNWLLTSKGAKFLHGEPVPKFAIISKATGHQIGYWDQERYQVTIKDFRPDHEYWEGIHFDIVDGKIVAELPKPMPQRKKVETQEPLFAMK